MNKKQAHLILFGVKSNTLWTLAWAVFAPPEAASAALLVTAALGLIGCLLGWRGLKRTELTPARRRLAMLIGVSIGGWLALTILFALFLLAPELGVQKSWLVGAWLVHMFGAAGAMWQLRQPEPE